MNRTLLLALAMLLGLTGIAISVVGHRTPPPAPPRTIAIARTNIPKAGVRIEASMLEEQSVPADKARFAYDFEEAIGMVSIEPIKAGQPIGPDEARSIEELRLGVKDLSFEITSFSGRFDQMIGGQLKPGVLVNIYGYREGRGPDDPGDVKLIAHDVWVVDVRASSGEAAGRPTPTPSTGGGSSLLSGPGFAGRGEVPASIVTVAGEPEVIWHVIEALGAGGYQAWVTLAGTRVVTPTSTPEPTVYVQPTYTPYPTYTPFPTPTPATQATPVQTPTEIAGVPTPCCELPETGSDRPGN